MSYSISTIPGKSSDPIPSSSNIVYLGLGSNLGDRLKNLSDALEALSKPIEHCGAAAKLLDSSFVYSSDPMYVTDQPEFLNAACKISTPLSPIDLLKVIKRIESDQGRVLENVPRNGPRPIDIDILLFNSDIVTGDILSIPHIRMAERKFVLEPLTDMASQVIHPLYQTPISSLLADLKRTSHQSTIRMTHITSRSTSPTLDLLSRTHLMSIVNCTPDSFSDGGESYLMEDAIRNCLEHASAGADILDIGGMSTRPGATDVSVEEEIDRTVPVIQALREHHRVQCHISIDTFRAATARAAVQAGATIVNDVSGGEADPEMYSTIAELDVPYVIMHMRGNPRTMSRLASYADSDVIEGVRTELVEKVRRALQSGIKRWNIILDPGFGFAKDLRGNCLLLNSLDRLTAEIDPGGNRNPLNGFPLLVGLSRKTFLGQLASGHHQTLKDDVGRDDSGQITSSANDRLAPTIAASVMSILHGAHLIRVHDTKVMKDVLKTVDGIRLLGSKKG